MSVTNEIHHLQSKVHAFRDLASELERLKGHYVVRNRLVEAIPNEKEVHCQILDVY